MGAGTKEFEKVTYTCKDALLLGESGWVIAWPSLPEDTELRGGVVVPHRGHSISKGTTLGERVGCTQKSNSGSTVQRFCK